METLALIRICVHVQPPLNPHHPGLE